MAMIKSVLLDLDNTLLHNPDRQWVASFREQWDRYFAASFGLKQASDSLRHAIGNLNREPAAFRTNADTILDALDAEMPLTKAELRAASARFYEADYCLLKAYTSPLPSAVQFVESLLNQNLLVAIATNPLFPEAATLERIAWAGLSEFAKDFAYITHSENMHFAKPSPAYFAEAVARVGVEPDEALLIGDSVRQTILEPASAIGIHTWKVDDNWDRASASSTTTFSAIRLAPQVRIIRSELAADHDITTIQSAIWLRFMGCWRKSSPITGCSGPTRTNGRYCRFSAIYGNRNRRCIARDCWRSSSRRIPSSQRPRRPVPTCRPATITATKSCIASSASVSKRLVCFPTWRHPNGTGQPDIAFSV